jgi:hypothetical protein
MHGRKSTFFAKGAFLLQKNITGSVTYIFILQQLYSVTSQQS